MDDDRKAILAHLRHAALQMCLVSRVKFRRVPGGTPCWRTGCPSNMALKTAEMHGRGTAGVLHPSSGPSRRRNSGADCQPATRKGLSPDS